MDIGMADVLPAPRTPCGRTYPWARTITANLLETDQCVSAGESCGFSALLVFRGCKLPFLRSSDQTYS